VDLDRQRISPAGPAPIEGFAVHGWVQGAIDMACEAMLPIENNLDICHAAFTHPHQHPQWFRVQAMGLTLRDYAVETSAHGVTVTGTDTLLRYTLPDRVEVISGERLRLVLHHVPTTQGRCRQHWLLRREGDDMPGTPVWSDREPDILAQDRRLLETAQHTCDEGDDAFERSVEADAPGLAARRLIRTAAAMRLQPPHIRHITVLG
jgi:chloramphenicol 3-O-phosphotransferase